MQPTRVESQSLRRSGGRKVNLPLWRIYLSSSLIFQTRLENSEGQHNLKIEICYENPSLKIMIPLQVPQWTTTEDAKFSLSSRNGPESLKGRCVIKEETMRQGLTLNFKSLQPPPGKWKAQHCALAIISFLNLQLSLFSSHTESSSIVINAQNKYKQKVTTRSFQRSQNN